MRLYTFTHCYISSIQNGIQTAHIQGELANKVFDGTYHHNGDKANYVTDWSLRHKTIINCNGGNSTMLKDLCKFFDSPENPYPWAAFREDYDSMEGMLTGVGIILPEEIYGVEVSFEGSGITRQKIFINLLSGNVYSDQRTYTYQLIDRIKSAPLAR